MTGQGKRHCYRVSCVEEQVALHYPGENLTSLLSGRARAAEARAAEKEAYRVRHQAMLESHIMSTYSSPTLKPFHKFIPERIMAGIAAEIAKEAVSASELPFRKTDRGEDWLLSHSTPLFAFFINTPGATGPIHRELIRFAFDHHTGRRAALDAGVPYEDPGTSDGKYLIGVCPTCYAKAAERKRQKGAEWSEEDAKDAQYMAFVDFLKHWIERADHCRTKLGLLAEIEGGGGEEVFQFLEGVEGAEPLRVVCNGEIYPKVVIP